MGRKPSKYVCLRLYIFRLRLHDVFLFQTVTALMRDAVLLFTQALKDMPNNFTTTPMDCFTPDEWDFGIQLMNKTKSVRGDIEANARRKRMQKFNG